MKKRISMMICIMMVFMLLAGCGTKGGGEEGKSDNKLKVALAIAGNLGDKGFNDNAVLGAEKAKEEFGIEFKAVEMTQDKTKYEPTLIELSESEEYDLITVAGYTLKEVLEKVAPQFPDQKYFLYDSNMEYDKGDFDNVYSATFMQNEASFLGGVVAGRMTNSDLPDINDQKNIGAIAMMDMAVINDFIVGFIEGAQYVDPDMKINTAYIGAVDAAKAKDMAVAQYSQGTDIIFPIAASAGLGVIEAALEKNGYVIGVDQDQAMALKESNPEKAERILTSVLKRVDTAMYKTIKMMVEEPDSIPWGTTDTLGMEDDCVGIAKSEYYEKLVDEETKKLVEEVEEKIKSGDIKVGTAIGMDADTLTNLRDSVRP